MKQLLACYLGALALLIVLQCVSSQSWGGGDYFGRGRAENTRPIKCYQCNSFYDKGCADFFDNMTYPLIPCPGNATMCRKIIQETYYDGIWDVRYIRQCATLGEVGPNEGRWCKERTGSFRVKVKYCHCDNKDGCNTAASLTLNYKMLLILPLLTLFTSLYGRLKPGL